MAPVWVLFLVGHFPSIDPGLYSNVIILLEGG